MEPALGFASEGDMPSLGVGTGVALADEVAAAVWWVCDVDAELVYGWPNSPGVKDSVEQNPSDELMIKVDPSFDL